jgi:hypothetical protein
MTDGPPTHALDLRQLLAILEQHAVEYTVIGGIAVQVHGHRRTTKDLDVIPSPETDNLQRLSAALQALAAVPRGMPGNHAPTVEQLEAAAIVPPLTTRHGELHVLRDVPGAPPYGDLRSRALVVDLDGLAIAIAGLDDLIAMKRASARPSDLRDIAALVAAAEHQRAG